MYSIVQMPPGIPVATVAINGALNAGLLAAKILATNDEELSRKVSDYAKSLKDMVDVKAKKLEDIKYQAYLDLLLGTDEPAITEEQAMEIALEEGKKEIYQYQSWESDFSDGVLAQLQEDGVPEHLWESDWAAKDENGLPLYTGQRLWAVNLTDRNDPLTHLLIYIDAETGAVIGAGKLSD